MEPKEVAQPEVPSIDVAPQENLIPQSRLDEVTAARREAERKADELSKQLLELSAQQAQQAAQFQAQLIAMQQSQRPAADPYAQLRERDPDLVRSLEAAHAQQAEQFRVQRQQLEAQNKLLEVRLLASSIPGITTETQTKAAQYMQRWAAAGVPATAEDAINFALGEERRQQLVQTANVRGITPPPTPVLTQPNAPPAAAAQPQGLPPNFDRLSPEQQEAYLDKLYGDMPF